VSSYLDRAKQFVQTLPIPPAGEEPSPLPNLSEGSTGLILLPDDTTPAAASFDLLVDEAAAQQELWEERLAIMEYDGGIPDPARSGAVPNDLEALILPALAGALPQPSPHRGEGVFIVGEMCPACLGEGKISHLYQIQEGAHVCRRCLRRGG